MNARVCAGCLGVPLLFGDGNGRDFIFRRLHVAVPMGTGKQVKEDVRIVKGSK